MQREIVHLVGRETNVMESICKSRHQWDCNRVHWARLKSIVTCALLPQIDIIFGIDLINRMNGDFVPNSRLGRKQLSDALNDQTSAIVNESDYVQHEIAYDEKDCDIWTKVMVR
ncbi:hypothetical protein GJ496_009448 [Pomphorhynchus laevis]|nr:hypothetical protein GJ496_009448 [Pomphorhynchus laevis]